MSDVYPQEYRLAVSGESNNEILNYNWMDKPHRLVYDLCAEVDSNQELIAKLQADNDSLNEMLAQRGIDNTVLRINSHEQDRRVELLREELKRNRQGNFNLIELNIVPDRYFESVNEIVDRIDNVLAATDKG